MKERSVKEKGGARKERRASLFILSMDMLVAVWYTGSGPYTDGKYIRHGRGWLPSNLRLSL